MRGVGTRCGVIAVVGLVAVLAQPAVADPKKGAPVAGPHPRRGPAEHADTTDAGAEAARELEPGVKPRQKWAQPVLGPSRSGAPEVLFTFDDGPRSGTTNLILDALDAHGIEAIFFMAGWRVSDGFAGWQKRRAIVRRLLATGHWIGNHTVNHINLCHGDPVEAAHEIDENARRLSRLAGHAVTLFRAPYGARCKRLDALLAERTLRHLHWDLDAHEYMTLASADAVAEVTDRLGRLRGRAVLLLHDTKHVTARALPRVLAWLRDENLRRRAAGEAEIRILRPIDVVLDDVPTPLRALGGLAAHVAVAVAPAGTFAPAPRTPGVAPARPTAASARAAR